MKIAIDIRTASGEKTGKGWYTFNIVHELLKMDHENSYLLYCKEPVAGFEEFKNLELKVVNFPGLLWHYKVARDVEKEDVDIFFAPSSYIIPGLLNKNVKSIISVHDLVAFFFPDNRNKKATLLEKLFLKRAALRASKILAVSENTKRDLIKKFPSTEPKIEVINCAASEIFRPIPKNELEDFAVNTNLPPKFFLAVGTIEPRKNYPNLIQAFALFAKKNPDYNLVIVGGKGWGNVQIDEDIAHHRLQKKVHLLGYLSNTSLLKLYNLATALVFPSFYEGFGIPPLEAMQCGCPVIASNTSSIPEVVGDSSLMIDPRSPEQIAAAMQKIASDQDFAKALSEKGLNQSQKFSWEASAEKLHYLFSKDSN